MANTLRSKMVRLAASLPKGSSERKALLNVLAEDRYPAVLADIERDYRRGALTRGERTELREAVLNASSEREAWKIVDQHRRGRVATSKVGGFKYGDLYDALEKGAESYALETLGAMGTDLGVATGRPSRLSGDAKMLKWGLSFDMNAIDFAVVLEIYNFEAVSLRVSADGRQVFYENLGMYRSSAPWEVTKAVSKALREADVAKRERDFEVWRR